MKRFLFILLALALFGALTFSCYWWWEVSTRKAWMELPFTTAMTALVLGMVGSAVKAIVD